MARSRGEIPEFTLELVVEMDAAASLREDLRVLGREPLPSLNDVVVRAVALCLREFPAPLALVKLRGLVAGEHGEVGRPQTPFGRKRNSHQPAPGEGRDCGPPASVTGLQL